MYCREIILHVHESKEEEKGFLWSKVFIQRIFLCHLGTSFHGNSTVQNRHTYFFIITHSKGLVFNWFQIFTAISHINSRNSCIHRACPDREENNEGVKRFWTLWLQSMSYKVDTGPEQKNGWAVLLLAKWWLKRRRLDFTVSAENCYRQKAYKSRSVTVLNNVFIMKCNF